MNDGQLVNAKGGTAFSVPAFSAALLAAGLEGVMVNWGGDGLYQWADGVTDARKAAVLALAAEHDPTDRRPELLAYAARRRWQTETGGIVLNGARIATDEVSQSKIGNAYSLLLVSGAPSVEFKTGDGFVTLTVEQFKALALAVGGHIQACFAKEAEVGAMIKSGPSPTGSDEEREAAFRAALAAIDAVFAALAPSA